MSTCPPVLLYFYLTNAQAYPNHPSMTSTSSTSRSPPITNRAERRASVEEVSTRRVVKMPGHNADVHVTGNTTNGMVSKSAAPRLPESNASSSFTNSVPPCPTNNRAVQVRGGSLMLESTSSRRSPTELLEGMLRPACRMAPLPKASTWTQTSRGASAALSEGCIKGPFALPAALVPGAAV